MGKKSSKPRLPGQALSLLRMALLWARKGGAFKYADKIKMLKPKSKLDTLGQSDRLCYMERQFSIDETPAFHLKMHRPSSLRWISSCINPQVNFDEDDDERNFFKWESAESRFELEAEENEMVQENDVVKEGKEGIDSKAEEFISRFYDQIKMQRQRSLLQYHEMLGRSIS